MYASKPLLAYLEIILENLFYTENSFLTILKTILRILETSESGLS
jgi:hypothetical protein